MASILIPLLKLLGLFLFVHFGKAAFFALETAPDVDLLVCRFDRPDGQCWMSLCWR